MCVPPALGDDVETDAESKSADENGRYEDRVPLEDGVIDGVGNLRVRRASGKQACQALRSQGLGNR